MYYENPEPKSVPRYRVIRHTWHLTVMDSIHTSAITRRSARNHDHSPTLNLAVHIKNTNQVHDPTINDIQLTHIALLCRSWSLLESEALPTEGRIQPQEMIHFLLKLRRKREVEEELSQVVLGEGGELGVLNFLQRRNLEAMDAPPKVVVEDDEPLSATLKLDATLVLGWKARLREGENVLRHASGQHHIDIYALNRPYNHPGEVRKDRLEFSGPLRIFGPDVNVAERKLVESRKEEFSGVQCGKNVISYCLSHSKSTCHDFGRNRLCVLPVLLVLQNNSQRSVDVRLDTVGTSR